MTAPTPMRPDGAPDRLGRAADAVIASYLRELTAAEEIPPAAADASGLRAAAAPSAGAGALEDVVV